MMSFNPAPLAVPREESVMHPITLQFYDKQLESALRVRSHSKLITLNAFLIASMLLMLATLVLQQKPIPPWVAVITLGFSIVHYYIRGADPYLAHAIFQAGVLLVTAVIVMLTVALSLGLLGELPSPAAAAHESARCPVWAITVNDFFSITWTFLTFWLHLNVSVKLVAFVCPVFVHFIHPNYPELGSASKEAQLLAAGLALGSALGHVFERSARQSFFEKARHAALELRLVQQAATAQAATAQAAAARGAAQSAINHTAKRVACNTVQVCEMALAHLEADASAAGLRAAFATHRDEARRAFHLCRSVLFRAAVDAGEYTPRREAFRLDELLEALTAIIPARFNYRVSPRDAPTISSDRTLLQNILLGAAHNALLHGGAGPLRVTLDLLGETLCLRVANAPGSNHARLLNEGGCDLLESKALMVEGKALGALSHQIIDHPSFVSLNHIRKASAVNPDVCSMSLRALPHEVLFELRMSVGVVRPRNTPSAAPPGDSRPLSYPVQSSKYDWKELPIFKSAAPTQPHPFIRTDSSTSILVDTSISEPFTTDTSAFETCTSEPSMADHVEPSTDRTPTVFTEAPTSASQPWTGGVATGTASTPAVSDVAPPLPKGLVFVHADDDAMPRMFMEFFLDYIAADASSLILGDEYAPLPKLPEAVASIAKRVGDDRVVVVLDQYMDLPGMPVVLGTDLCKKLREEHSFQGVVIILSANDEEENVALAMRAGADALLGKGVNNNMARLQTLVASQYYARYPQD